MQIPLLSHVQERDMGDLVDLIEKNRSLRAEVRFLWFALFLSWFGFITWILVHGS